MTHDEYVAYIRERFADLFDPANSDEDWRFLITIGPGWWPLFSDFCEQLEGILKHHDETEKWHIRQVKEKMGELRIYTRPAPYERFDVDGFSEWINDIDPPEPSAAQKMISIIREQVVGRAAHTCEECGELGGLRVLDGWYRTVCEQHFQELAGSEGIEMTEDEKSRKVAILDAAHRRIEAARAAAKPYDDVLSEFRTGFFGDRDKAWIETFHAIQREHRDDIDAWAKSFVDQYPIGHRRTVEAITAWADQLPWPDDRDGIDQARMAVRMAIAMRMSYGSEQKTYSLREFAQLLGVKEHAVWHIIDVGDIRPHAIIADFQRKSFNEVIESLRFSDSDIETFQQEIRRRRHEDFMVEYADVYVPDLGPGARGLEIGPGWISIVADYCDQLRALEAYHFVAALRWCKEKFGALRIYSGSDVRTLTPLQSYWLSRLRERARRQSLRTCQECGEPGRMRWGAHAATLCDRHAHLVGEFHPDDGVILDPDRTDQSEPPTWTDAELGLDQGVTMDLAKQIEIECRPYLDPDLRLDGTDMQLADLRRKLLAVDHAIGWHHEVKFRKRTRGYEIAIGTQHPMSTVDEIKRDAIIAEIEMIMSGEQS